ncbi:hypothetical protein NSK_003124 [Nannochloropsis salina CCMP1776]|uniref:AB hydrolase-1 domain-containing protein n=1 Tax=Nannochloropsis salina CCMP1776 TaxID=1027361 RepID=A0A4D9D824_9STRA|nr:hypothetical protein NSK_003124 [Nannochloropsis salina CCMP1776]|eukprot:TFJ85615.1 hypothetical protein NSK_003124 [Nannochloropsis salina CCMP1776]
MGNCDVFVADFRGRGLSRPPVSSLSNYGQHELIIDDVRAFSDGVAALLAREKGEEGNEGHTHSARQHWLAHSWGGIILSSALARYPSYASSVASQVWFGAKRVISVKSWEKVFKIDLVWGLLFPLLGKIYGFIPARRFKLGADDESLPFLSECSLWVRGGRWVDAKDGFDYAAGAQSMSNYVRKID